MTCNMEQNRYKKVRQSVRRLAISVQIRYNTLADVLMEATSKQESLVHIHLTYEGFLFSNLAWKVA